VNEHIRQGALPSAMKKLEPAVSRTSRASYRSGTRRSFPYTRNLGADSTFSSDQTRSAITENLAGGSRSSLPPRRRLDPKGRRNIAGLVWTRSKLCHGSEILLFKCGQAIKPDTKEISFTELSVKPDKLDRMDVNPSLPSAGPTPSGQSRRAVLGPPIEARAVGTLRGFNYSPSSVGMAEVANDVART